MAKMACSARMQYEKWMIISYFREYVTHERMHVKVNFIIRFEDSELPACLKETQTYMVHNFEEVKDMHGKMCNIWKVTLMVNFIKNQ